MIIIKKIYKLILGGILKLIDWVKFYENSMMIVVLYFFVEVDCLDLFIVYFIC